MQPYGLPELDHLLCASVCTECRLACLPVGLKRPQAEVLDRKIASGKRPSDLIIAPAQDVDRIRGGSLICAGGCDRHSGARSGAGGDEGEVPLWVGGAVDGVTVPKGGGGRIRDGDRSVDQRQGAVTVPRNRLGLRLPAQGLGLSDAAIYNGLMARSMDQGLMCCARWLPVAEKDNGV